MRKAACIAVLMIALAVGKADAAGKTTADPNVPGKAVASEADTDFWNGDKRLGQKVTYEARKQPVRTILADLTKMTATKLNAGYNAVDWQVRDRKMNVFVRDLPLREIMQSVARVMKFKWSRSKDEETGQWTYRLFMDRKTIIEAESAARREREKLQKEADETRKDLLGTLLELDKLSPEELNELKQANPVLYEQTLSDVGKSFAEFLRQTPDISGALTNGRPLELAASELPAASIEALQRAVEACLTKGTPFEGGGLGKQTEQFTSNPASEIRRFTIKINDNLNQYDRDPAARSWLGWVSLRYDDSSIQHFYWHPENPMVKWRAQMRIQSEETGRPYGDLVRENMSAGMAAEQQWMERLVFGEPLVTHPEDPDLDKKLKLTLERTGVLGDDMLADYQQALAEASGYGVVSDCFRVNAVGGVPTEAKAKAILEATSSGFACNWWKRGDIMEFRNRDWFYRRSLQIPDKQLDAWRQSMVRNGCLDIDAMSQIALLSWEQALENTCYDEVLHWMPGSETELLKLYASLSADQRQLLFSEGGLSSDAAAPSQRGMLRRLLPASLRNPSADAVGRSVLAATKSQSRSKDGKKVVEGFIYTFALTSSDTSEPLTWRVQTPIYRKLSANTRAAQ